MIGARHRGGEDLESAGAAVAPLDVLARCARCGLGFAGQAADSARVTELVVLHTRYCLGDDRSAEVWAPYEAVYASLRRHVVLVGADRAALDGLGHLLERAGHRVDAAEDGPEAMEIVLRSQPDVVVVDVDPPGIDAYDVPGRIRAAQGRRAPLLVALTGQAGRRARVAGFDTYLLKPPAAEEVDRVIVAAPRVAALRG